MFTLKLQAAKWGTLAGLGLATLHYGANAYVMTEQLVSQKLGEKQEHVAALIAESFGYERPVPKLHVEDIIIREAEKHRINPDLIHSLILEESGGNQFAVSPKGAIGLMQIMPSTARRLGVKDAGKLFDAETNITVGTKYFAAILKEQGGDPHRAIQAWNGSDACINKCQESVGLARKVLSRVAKL